MTDEEMDKFDEQRSQAMNTFSEVMNDGNKTELHKFGSIRRDVLNICR